MNLPTYINVGNGELFFDELAQVFLCEYAGPLLIYLLFYSRPAIIYGEEAKLPKAYVVEYVFFNFTFYLLFHRSL